MRTFLIFIYLWSSFYVADPISSNFAEAFPNCKVIGTDLSPARHWVPSNVTFIIEDFNNEWSFEDNSVDFIHARWLTGSVSDWNLFMTYAYRALKPGGWIESIEYDGTDCGAGEDTALGQWYHIFVAAAKNAGISAPWNTVTGRLIGDSIRQAGFTTIHEEYFKVRPPRLFEKLQLSQLIFLLLLYFSVRQIYSHPTFRYLLVLGPKIQNRRRLGFFRKP